MKHNLKTSYPFNFFPKPAGFPPVRVILASLYLCVIGSSAAIAQNGLIPDNPRPQPNLSRLGRVPDWNYLDRYQRTMTRDEFVYLLEYVYTRYEGEYKEVIEIMPDRVLIKRQANFTESGVYTLYFKEKPEDPNFADTYWRTTYELDAIPDGSKKVLEGVKIAIDPGHIGGEWVKWDDRHFKIYSSHGEVREGELTLKVAKILERDLTSLGAIVRLTRTSNNPVTELRPENLQTEARNYLARKGRVPSSWRISETAKAMFAISSEIQTRADYLNETFHPDLAVVLHFNAVPWGRRPSFRTGNHLHLLINGCYSKYEMAEDDSRFQMLRRLLERNFYHELAMCKEVEKSMVEETKLPPFRGYRASTGRAIGGSQYTFIRNLLGNRAFMCPVVFLEPYCMNDKSVYYRIQAGEYEGTKKMGGVYKKNIFQEYADGVTGGLISYFHKRRFPSEPVIVAQPIVAAPAKEKGEEVGIEKEAATDTSKAPTASAPESETSTATTSSETSDGSSDSEVEG